MIMQSPSLFHTFQYPIIQKEETSAHSFSPVSSMSVAPSAETTQALSRRQQQIKARLANRQRRACLALFVKLLLKTLEENNEGLLSLQARLVISACTNRNRSGDPNFANLSDTLERHLMAVVGDFYWRRTHERQATYLAHRWALRQTKRPIHSFVLQTNTTTKFSRDQTSSPAAI